jgi:hypothetical protein
MPFHKHRLPFDVLTTIAYVNIPVYRALLSLPRFGRASLGLKHQLLHLNQFTTHTITTYVDGCVGHVWSLVKRETNEMRHRLDGPAYICYYPDGQKKNEIWYVNGHRHRDNDPAVINYYLGGQMASETWYVNGMRHRLDGPAVIRADGYQAWYFNNKFHRIGGPAIIATNTSQEYYPGGYQAYYRHGEFHRLDGPAVIYSDGREEYYINGLSTTKERIVGNLVR